MKAQPESRTTLLARSDMQTPKSIPIIRPLRFQEIPARFNVHGAERRASDMANASGEQKNDGVRGENGPAIGREANSTP